MPEVVIALPHLPYLYDKNEDKWQGVWRGAVAEFFAVAIFVFIGTGSVVACKEALGYADIKIPSITLISLAHGFTIMVLVYSIGEISGGHINPAVTWACLFTGKISVLRAVIYVLSQLFGSVVGSSLLRSMLSPAAVKQSGMGTHAVNSSITVAQGFWAETIFTFIFIFVVFSTAISPFAGKFAPLRGGENGKQYGPGKLTPFAVGMTILMLHTVGIKFTGASMNPARTFGPALVNQKWANHWVYWAGPLLGSTIAAVISQLIFLSTPRDIFRLNQDTAAKIPDAPVPAMAIVEIKAGPEVNRASSGSTSPRGTRSPRVIRADFGSHPEIQKVPSGQFSAIMEEEPTAVVELDEI